MKKYFLLAFIVIILNSCNEFLTLQPEYRINENNFYSTANDFETALIGNYSELQEFHEDILYLTELTTDNSRIYWSNATASIIECDDSNITSTNIYVNSVWNSCFTTISRCNNILSRIEDASINESLKSQFKGEALFLRAYCYFYLVRLFGDLPVIETAFRSPDEISGYDMSRKTAGEVYQLIISDLNSAADLLQGITGLSKSRASWGAAETMLGKVYLTQKEYVLAATVLKEVIDGNGYSLETSYESLFTNGNDELEESVFEIKYMSGNVGEGNYFSSMFTPFMFDMAIFPGNMTGAQGGFIPTSDMAMAYETGDLRRTTSIADSVLLKNGSYAKEFYGLKFVDFTTGIVGDGGINFTSLRYADVLLMYAEALNETDKTADAHQYLNMVRNRVGLASLNGLSKSALTQALENERRVEFVYEGHRWFDLVRTGRAKAVMNNYFTQNGLGHSVEDYELLMPIPQREIDIDPKLEQNPEY